MSKTTETPQTVSDAEVKSRKKELIIGSIVVAVLLAIVASIIFFINTSSVRIVYQPAKACEILTLDEVREFLGGNAIMTGSTEPAVTGNVATSKCGYTDGSGDTEKMRIAAIKIRSGINDQGVEQNKGEFASGRPKENTETVKDLGDSSYFNTANGQLNILDGYNWIIISYGVASELEMNKLDEAVAIAQKVVN